MQSSITHHTTTRKSLEIIIPASEINAEYEKVITKIRLKARIPGFRQGKASKEVLLAHYGREINSEIAETLIKKYFLTAAKEVGLSPVSNPALSDMELEENKDGKFNLIFDIAPEVVIPNYKGLTLIEKKRLIDDSDIDERLEVIRQEAAKLMPISDGVAQVDQHVTIDLTVKPQGLKAKQYNDKVIQLAAERPFDAEILNMRIGEQKTFSLKVPDDDPNKFMAGKNLTYNVTIKDIRTREVPEINDDLAKDIGPYEDLADLKSFIRKDLESLAEKDAVSRVHQSILETLVDSTQFEVPESMIALQLDDYCREFAEMIARQGIDPKNINWEAYRQSRFDDAKRAIKSGYIIQTIGNSEDIQASDEELDVAIKEIIKERHITTSFEAFKKKLTDDGSIKEIEGRTRTYKILHHIISFANLTKETLDKEAFSAMIEAERQQLENDKPQDASSNDLNNAVSSDQEHDDYPSSQVNHDHCHDPNCNH